MKLKSEFDTHSRKSIRTEYRLLSNEIQNLSYHIDRANGAAKERMLAEYQQKRKVMLKMDVFPKNQLYKLMTTRLSEQETA